MDEDLKKSILKTGTTILGIVCKDGIVMAADRQTTAGRSVVVNKNKQKVKQINDYLVFSGAGVSSDIDRLARILPAQLKIKELGSKSRPSVRQAASLIANITYSGIRQPSMIPMQAGILLAGFNEDGTTELYTIEPAGGFTKVEDYDANLGSGMQYAYGLLERKWEEDMSIKEGVELAKESIKSSTQRDTGSGYGIDIFSITKNGIKKEASQKISHDYEEEVKPEQKSK